MYLNSQHERKGVIVFAKIMILQVVHILCFYASFISL